MSSNHAINVSLNDLNQELMTRVEILQRERDDALDEVDSVTERLSNIVENVSQDNDRLDRRARALKDAVNRASDYAAFYKEQLQETTEELQRQKHSTKQAEARAEELEARVKELSLLLEEVTEGVDESEEPEVEVTEVELSEVPPFIRDILDRLEDNALKAATKATREANEADKAREEESADDCPCPGCTIRRSMGIAKQG